MRTQDGCRDTDPLALGRDVERFPQHILLHDGAPVLVLLLETALAEDFLFRLDIERNLEELLVEERNSRFESPRHGRLVRAEAVGRVEVLDASDTFLVEVGGRRRGVEVEVTYAEKNASELPRRSSD